MTPPKKPRRLTHLPASPPPAASAPAAGAAAAPQSQAAAQAAAHPEAAAGSAPGSSLATAAATAAAQAAAAAMPASAPQSSTQQGNDKAVFGWKYVQCTATSTAAPPLPASAGKTVRYMVSRGTSCSHTHNRNRIADAGNSMCTAPGTQHTTYNIHHTVS